MEERSFFVCYLSLLNGILIFSNIVIGRRQPSFAVSNRIILNNITTLVGNMHRVFEGNGAISTLRNLGRTARYVVTTVHDGTRQGLRGPTNFSNSLRFKQRFDNNNLVRNRELSKSTHAVDDNVRQVSRFILIVTIEGLTLRLARAVLLRTSHLTHRARHFGLIAHFLITFFSLHDLHINFLGIYGAQECTCGPYRRRRRCSTSNRYSPYSFVLIRISSYLSIKQSTNVK